MDAVVSGRAGIALLMDGERLLSLHAGRPGEVVQRHDGEVRWLLGEAKDLEFLENVDLKQIALHLDLASGKADALHLALILLDAGLSHDTRRSAAEELDDLLEVESIVRWVESVLFAHPLPRSADPFGARSACTGRTERTRALLGKLKSLQPVIVEVQQAWEAIPARLFATVEDRKHALSVVVKEGLFRELVTTRAVGERVDDFLLKSLMNPALHQIRDARNVLLEWGADFREPRTAAPPLENEISFVAEGIEREMQEQDCRLVNVQTMREHIEWRKSVFPFPEGIDGDTGLPVPWPGMDEVAYVVAERSRGREPGKGQGSWSSMG
jgi:hypothetical protein